MTAYPSLYRLAGILLLGSFWACNPLPRGRMMTVTGRYPVSQMGLTLIHEHVFLDWTGADSIRPQDWDNDAAIRRILPHLRAMQQYGVRTMLECTPNYIGRNPLLLKRLADSTGLQILTNTGYYGAVNDRYVPRHAYQESARQLARRWIREYREGIDGTGIRPGFIKIAVDPDPVLSAIDQKIVRAACITHRRTGLAIVSHTGPDTPALQQLKVLRRNRIKPNAWIWTHAQGGTNAVREKVARRGAWISLDGLGWTDPTPGGDSTALYNYVDALLHLKNARLLRRVLIAHDAGWYTHNGGFGQKYQPYTAIFTTLIPVLRQKGFTELEIQQMLVNNPSRAYAIKKRVREED